MKLLLRSAVVLAVLAAALAPSPATAAPTPYSVLTGVSITFVTTDENKDADTEVDIGLSTSDARSAATFHGYFEEFGPGTVHGPYSLLTFTGVHAYDLAPARLGIYVDPNGHDTWRFNYSATLTFADGSSYVVTQTNQTVSQSSPGVSAKFTVGTQTTVPALAHLTADAARAAIRAAGLTVGTSTNQVDKDCADIGRVVGQDPAAGKLVDVGAKVNIRVGVEPPNECQ